MTIGRTIASAFRESPTADWWVLLMLARADGGTLSFVNDDWDDATHRTAPTVARAPFRDWVAGVGAHLVVLVASGFAAAGGAVFATLATQPLTGPPTRNERLAATLIIGAAVLVVLLPQIALVRIRLRDRPHNRAAVVGAAAVGVALVVIGLASANQLAVARREERAAAADQRLLAGLGVDLYRPQWLPSGFARRVFRRSDGGGAVVVYGPPPTRPNNPAYYLEETRTNSPNPSPSGCSYPDGAGPIPMDRCRAIGAMPTGETIYSVDSGVANEAVLTVRFRTTVVTLTAVWDATANRAEMMRTMRSLTPGSPA